MKDKIINLIKNPIFIIIILTLMIPIYLFSYGKINSDFKNAKKVAKEISNINLTLNNGIVNNELNIEKSLDILNKNKNSLEEVKSFLCNLNYSKKYTHIFNNLVEAVNSNLNLYDHSMLILKNLKSKDIDQGLKHLNESLAKTTMLYDKCKNNGLKSNLMENGQPFYKKFNYHLANLIKMNRDSTVAYSQKDDFIRNLENCINDLEGIQKNLIPAIERIRTEKKDFSVVINDIETKMQNLINVKNTFYAVPIPSNSIDLLDEFNLLFDKSSNYLNSLKEAVKLEDLFKKIDYKKSLENYKSSKDCFNTFKQSFNNFIKQK